MMKQKLWILTELFPPDETSTSYIMEEIANAMTRKYNVGVILDQRFTTSVSSWIRAISSNWIQALRFIVPKGQTLIKYYQG